MLERDRLHSLPQGLSQKISCWAFYQKKSFTVSGCKFVGEISVFDPKYVNVVG